MLTLINTSEAQQLFGVRKTLMWFKLQFSHLFYLLPLLVCMKITLHPGFWLKAEINTNTRRSSNFIHIYFCFWCAHRKSEHPEAGVLIAKLHLLFSRIHQSFSSIYKRKKTRCYTNICIWKTSSVWGNKLAAGVERKPQIETVFHSLLRQTEGLRSSQSSCWLVSYKKNELVEKSCKFYVLFEIKIFFLYNNHS